MKMKIIDSFDVPEDVAGYLEWVSGILFVNRTLEEWREFLNRSGPDSLKRQATLFDQTITHETYHFYQIATTGYLYRHVSKLFAEVAAQIGFPVTEESLERLMEHIPSESARTFGALLAEIDRPGPNDLTVRDIVESAAYLYEYKSHYPAFDVQSFKEQIEIENLPKEYRYAFELAEERLGDSAFDNFLVISVLSLCFDNPTEAFYTAIEAIRRSGIVYTRLEDLKPLLATSEEISMVHHGLGTATQVAFEDGHSIEYQNPIFREATYRLNNNASKLHPLALLVDPEVMRKGGAEVIRPMQLKDGVVWIPDEFKKRVDADVELENTIKALIILGVVSLKLENTIQLARFRRPLA